MLLKFVTSLNLQNMQRQTETNKQQWYHSEYIFEFQVYGRMVVYTVRLVVDFATL